MSIILRVLNQRKHFFQQAYINFTLKNLIPTKLSFNKRKPFQAFIKRAFDILASSFGLVCISPILFLIAIIIRLDSNGPVIFKQKRLGLNANEFFMYKFRTMYDGAHAEEDTIRKSFDETDQVMFKISDDIRVTRVGKYLRKYSLDEFPQLINVIKGEMSLVGPRPILPDVLRLLKKNHFTYFAVRPGITGLWQTSGRSSIKNFNKVVALEAYYIKNWNLLLDFYLLLKTIPVVISGKNAS